MRELSMIEGPYELPEGWRWVRLEEVCVINPRRPRLQVDEAKPTTFVPMAAVSDQSGEIVAAEIRPFKDVSKGYTYFEEGDILFAKITPCMENGKSAIAKNLLSSFGFGSTEFHVLRPSESVLSEWVWLFVRREEFRKDAKAVFRGGVGQQRVPAEFLKETPIPLPPLPEQRRIVARIEELMERVREAKRLREEAKKDADRLMQAALAEVFPLSVMQLERQWPIKSLAEDDLVSVIPGQHILSSDYSKTQVGVPYITGPADFGLKYPLISKWTLFPKVFCHPGDILLTVKGAGVGKVNCAPLKANASIGRQIMAIRPNQGKLITAFLYYFLRSRFEAFQEMGQSATVPGIRKDQLKQFPIPVPPLSEQHRIVAYLDKIQAQVTALKQAQEATETELHRLEQAILDKAFRGEL